jgi:hypothetical protein
MNMMDVIFDKRGGQFRKLKVDNNKNFWYTDTYAYVCCAWFLKWVKMERKVAIAEDLVSDDRFGRFTKVQDHLGYTGIVPCNSLCQGKRVSVAAMMGF